MSKRKKNTSEERFTCKRCGSKRITIIDRSSKTGVYCYDCNAFHMPIQSDSDYRSAVRYIKRTQDNDNITFRYLDHSRGNVIVRCEKCGCLLHDSSAVPPKGQLDLIFAKYCPTCGRKIL